MNPNSYKPQLYPPSQEIMGLHVGLYIPFLSLACLSFIFGIILSTYIKVDFLIIYLIALFTLLVLFFLHKRHRNCSYVIILLFFFMGILREVNSSNLDLDDVYSFSKLKLRKVTLQGRVVSPIEESQFGKSFIFAVENIKVLDSQGKIRGKALVRFNKRINLNYDDVLTIEGRIGSIKEKGYFNKNLMRMGVRSVLVVGRRDWITIHKMRHFSIQRLALQVKERLKMRFEDISSPAKDFLIAFILGDRGGLDKDIYSAFKQTGTVHILAISGLHIVIVIFILIVFLKAIGLKIKGRFIITVLFLLFYSFMTGLRPSVVRAVIMGIVFLWSFLVKREYHVYNSLALSAMIILFIWPWQIFDIGFQLSFISVLAIVFISPKILAVLPKMKNRFLNYIQISLVISLSTWFVTMPLVAYYFGIVSLASLIANLFVIPLVPFIIAGSFIYLLASFFVNIFIKWFALSLEFIIEVLIFLTIVFRGLPFSYFYIEKFGPWILLVYYVVIILLFNIFNYVMERKRF